MAEQGFRVARIDLAALRGNYAELAHRAEGRAVIAVVKADAYGHGAVPVSRALADAGCRCFAVVTVDEAEELRAAGIEGVAILVLGGAVTRAEAERALALDLMPVIHHRPQLDLSAAAAAANGRTLDVQVEVDTGMRRMGVAPEAAVDFIAEVAATTGLRLAGVFTHLARADEADLGPTREQLTLFSNVLEGVRARGIDPGTVHIANSAAILAAREIPEVLDLADAVRPGLSLYGSLPAEHLQANLQPVMNLSAQVATLRSVGPGDAVGYGATHRFSDPSRVATIPLGYADGIPRSLSNRGCVRFACGKRPIVGRVSMDSITVDVGNADVALGDEALIFGRNDSGCLPIEEVAERAGTISYELMVRLGRRVPRLYV